MDEPTTAKPLTDDRHRAVPPERWTKPFVAQITQNEVVIACSCGWAAKHRRTRIREDKAERHVNKRHGGQAAWM